MGEGIRTLSHGPRLPRRSGRIAGLGGVWERVAVGYRFVAMRRAVLEDG